MRTLDRYVIREILPPFLLALGLFTFVLAINPMLDYAKDLLAKGLPAPTVGLLLALLVPQALSLTIPMAFLTGLLMALGRISGDRESIALLSCGVSPMRLLRPVLIVATVVGGLDMYILMKVKPDANQTFREITFTHLAEKTAADIKPRIFFEQFPGLMLFIGGTSAAGDWSQVLLADTSDPDRPAVTLAESGRLEINRTERQVSLVLANATQYTPGRTDARAYDTAHWNPLVLKISAESVFGPGALSFDRGFPEMGYAELKQLADANRAKGISVHNETMHMQQMFSFPVACLVFALLGLPVGLNTRKEGRLAALTIGLAIIASYYLLMEVAEGWVKGEAGTGGPRVPAEWARWVPNIVLGFLGAAALWRSSRTGNARPLIVLPRLPFPRGRSAEAGRESVASRSTRSVFVLPIPQLRWPRLLDRYVSSQYIRMAALSFLALLTLYYIGAVVDLAEKVFKGQAGSQMVLRYLWYSTPEFISFVIPIATLVGVLGTIGALTRSGELMVMRASGVSLYRAALPLLLFACVWGGVLFVLEDRVLGESKKTAGTLKDTIRSGRPPHAVGVADVKWTVGDDGRIYHYAAFEVPNGQNANSPTLHSLSVFETASAPYRLTRHTFAQRAAFEGGVWQARVGWTQAFAGDTVTREEFDRLTLPLPAVEDFRRAQVDASRMTYRELREYVRRLGASGFNVAEQAVNLQRKLAFPAVTIVMTLLAIPFGVTTGKKGALYGIGLAAVLAGAYFLLLTVFTAVGAAGVLPPALAAWAPNILFGSGALFLMFTVRT